MEGTKSRTTYAIPMKPIKDPKTLSMIPSPRRMDPVKM
jgi:hypothetical protein